MKNQFNEIIENYLNLGIMSLQLKTIQKVVSVFIILVSSIIFITYSHTSFATLTERSGFYGSLYLYYNVDRVLFGIYNLIVALLSTLMIAFQLLGIIRNQKIIFIRGTWLFLCMAILLIVGEVYLQMRFHGKG